MEVLACTAKHLFDAGGFVGEYELAGPRLALDDFPAVLRISKSPMISFLALWVFQRFELSLESAGSIFFWTGRLFGRVLSRGGSAGGAIRAYWHDGFYARAVESAAAPDAVHAEPPAGDPVSAVA